MAECEWQFRLAGDDFDVNGLAELFSIEAKITKGANGDTYLHMSLPYDSSEVQAAHDAGEELLAKLNAIVHMIHGNHENVRIAAMGLQDPSGGPLHQFILGAGGIRSRSRVSIAGVVISGLQSTGTTGKLVGDRVLEAADKNEYLDRALYLFGTLSLDWRGLYMVLEAAEDANGGESGLIGKNWVPQGQIRSFKSTANSYKAIRRAARHGSTRRGIPSASITLDDAQDMVRRILENWSKDIA